MENSINGAELTMLFVPARNQEPSPSKRVGSFFELVQIPWGVSAATPYGGHPPWGGACGRAHVLFGVG